MFRKIFPPFLPYFLCHYATVVITFLLYFSAGARHSLWQYLYMKILFVSGGDTLPYRMLLPAHYNPAKIPADRITAWCWRKRYQQYHPVAAWHGCLPIRWHAKLPAFAVATMRTYWFLARIGFTSAASDSLNQSPSGLEQPIGKAWRW